MKISQVIIQLNKFNDEYLLSLKQEFNHFDQSVHHYFLGDIYKCDWNKEAKLWQVEYSNNEDNYTEEIDFKKYLFNHLTGFTSLINDTLISIHLNYDSKKFMELVDSIIKQLQSLLNKKKVSDADNLNIFEKTIDQLIKDISEKHINNYTPQISKFEFQPKIKWLGTINSLATFLYDYSSDKNNLNRPLMENNRTAFENLMIHCFVDENDKSFSLATIKKYLDPNAIIGKRAKREKNQIILPKSYAVEEVKTYIKGLKDH